MPGSPSRAVAENHEYNEVELPASIEIKESLVSAGQPGAFCKVFIKKDTRFGPYKGEIINPSQKAEIDYRYAWEVFEKKRNVLKFIISASDPKMSNWMRNVNCARFYEEQNILSTQDGFSIFYIAMKDIKPGEELLTWFDPQLLKRTQRRLSRGERRKVGYTIELVPWSDEKKFVPEIIETKRTRKKKLLGEDMLCFQEDAALMQKSMNSMFRIPRKTDSHLQSNSSYSKPKLKLCKIQPTASPPLHVQTMKDDGYKDCQNLTHVFHLPKKDLLPVVTNTAGVKMEEIPETNSISSSEKLSQKREKDALRKRRERARVHTNRKTSLKSFTEKLKDDSSGFVESSTAFNPNDPNLLKPVIIRTKENGVVEMEDHDETYTVEFSTSIRQECDDLCQCIDKSELLVQEHDASSFIEKRNKDYVVRFSFLPEHQNFTVNNKVIYKCDICDSSYNHAFSLKRHYLGIHINHRYLSKDDITACQLETFHNGVNTVASNPNEVDESLLSGSTNQDSVTLDEDGSEKRGSNTISINNLDEQSRCLKNSLSANSDETESLFCNETLADLSCDNSDEIKKKVHTLKSSVHSEVQANHLKANENNNSFKQDPNLTCNHELSDYSEGTLKLTPKIKKLGDSVNKDEKEGKEILLSYDGQSVNTEDIGQVEDKILDKFPLEKNNTEGEKANDKDLMNTAEEFAVVEQDKPNDTLEVNYRQADLLTPYGGSAIIIENSFHEKLSQIDAEVNSTNDMAKHPKVNKLSAAMDREITEEVGASVQKNQRVTEEKSVALEIELSEDERTNASNDLNVSEEQPITMEIKMNEEERSRDDKEIKASDQESSAMEKEISREERSDVGNNMKVSGKESVPLKIELSEKKSANFEKEMKFTEESVVLKDGLCGEEKNLSKNDVMLHDGDIPDTKNEEEGIVQNRNTVSLKNENRGSETLNLSVGETVNSSKETCTSSQAQLPAQTCPSHSQASSVKSSLSQQFLLLVPIMSQNSSTSSLSPTPVSMTPLASSQSRSGMPIVVLSSQATSTTSAQYPTSSNSVAQSLVGQSRTITVLSSPISISNHKGSIMSDCKSNDNKLLTVSNKSVNSNRSTSTSLIKSGVTTEKSPRKNVALIPTWMSSDDTSKTVQEAEQPADLYRCHMCVLVYKSMNELKYHIRNDPHRFKGGLKQYACLQCSVRFRNKANLARHNLMHHQTGDDKDRKFRCLTCGKGFTSETYLKMHARFHLGKSFPCKYGCVDAFFPNAGTLVKHLRAVHPGLNLKEYLREKALKERLKLQSMTNGSEYSKDHPGIGFQAKRGRPKGSRNIPKEIKLHASREPFLSPDCASVINRTEKGFSNWKSLSTRGGSLLEKSWQKGSYQLTKENELPTVKSQELLSNVRRFNCKVCDVSFLSHLCLLKHRSKRHGASQSVQEFLFEMSKDKENQHFSEEEELQFSPPPSPKTFFASVNKRGAENMSEYIEGGADMLKKRKKLCPPDKETSEHFSTLPQLEWTQYNFPPCFKYARDCTKFYNETVGKKLNESDTNESVTEHKDNDSMFLETGNDRIHSNDENSHIFENQKDFEDTRKLDEERHSNIDDKSCAAGDQESVDSICKSIINDVLDIPKETEEIMTLESENINKDYVTGTIEKVQVFNVNDSDLVSELGAAPIASTDISVKGFPETRIEIQDFFKRLNKSSIRALNLEVGSKYIDPNFSSNDYSLLDPLNLIFKEAGVKPVKKLMIDRKKRERFASLSSSRLIHSKKLSTSRDQLIGSAASPELLKHEPRRYSIWQGMQCNKAGTKASDKFCCPVVEIARQQKTMRERKEMEDRNEKEKIEVKPNQKNKEDFAAKIGLMSRREFERSYHAIEKPERHIKPPEIWEKYNHIWFGKKGTITVVCSICHRHFSCLELCLRHQLKKHPHIEPSSLEMERDNYVEDMYYYYPMPYGILAQTCLVPDKLPSPEVYVCSRCKFPFKNINKLHAHMVLCDPNSNNPPFKHKPVNIDIQPSTIMPKGLMKDLNAREEKPLRQRVLPNRYKSYQMLKKSPECTVRDKHSSSSENRAVSKSPVSMFTTNTQGQMNFSGLPRRKRNHYGLLYNPSNHTRRRELYQVLDQHQCLGCNLKFKSMSMLERHVKKCSGKDKLKNQKPLLSGMADELMVRKQHTCRYCNKRFTFIKGVDLHYKRICSVRKIKEEENQLTEEDLTHEAELERIIEHLKWSKSLNKDSSDIIQGRVKVEEDGTLTRVDKKRGRPFGTGKRIKKKGFKWTTLKHHRQEDDNKSVSSSGQSSPRTVNPEHQDIKTEISDGSSAQTLSDKMTKSFRDLSGIYDRGEETMDDAASVSGTDFKSVTRKRGRPFKNRMNSSHTSMRCKRMRGRPKKISEESRDIDTFQKTQSLKDSINFKRGEIKLQSYSQRQKVSDSKVQENGKDSKFRQEFLSRNDSTNKREIKPSLTRRKQVEHPSAEVTKPPARKRGRPKKFDPSDMESSYKKKKKTDPGYVPCIRRISRDSLKPENSVETLVEEHTNSSNSQQPDNTLRMPKQMEDVRMADKTKEPKEIIDMAECNTTFNLKRPVSKLSQNKEFTEEKEKEWDKEKAKALNKEKQRSSQMSGSFSGKNSQSKEKITPLVNEHKQSVFQEQPSQILPNCAPNVKGKKERDNGTKNICNKSQGDRPVEVPKSLGDDADKGAKSKPLVVSPKNSKGLNSPNQKSLHCQSTDIKKIKLEIASSGDSRLKKSNPVGNETEQFTKKETGKKETLQQIPVSEESSGKHNSKLSTHCPSEGKVSPALQSQHSLVALSTTLAGNIVQTPVAVRIVTVPVSDAQQLSSLGAMKVIRSPEHSSIPSTSLAKVVCVSSSSPSTNTVTVVSSPPLKLTVTQSPHSKSPTSNTTGITAKTITGTKMTTAKLPVTALQNVNSSQGKQSSAFPVTQVIPLDNGKLLIPPQAVQNSLTSKFVIHSSPRRPMPSVSQGLKTSLLSSASNTMRHVTPSTVLLSSGKVVPVAGSVVTGSSLVQNPVSQQGNKIRTIGNVIRPPNSVIRSQSHSTISGITRPVIRKGKSVVIEQTAFASSQGTALPKSYYVQTSLSNSVVMDKAAPTLSTGSKSVLLSLGDKSTKVIDTIAVPQLQFIPVSLVQGEGSGQTPNSAPVTSPNAQHQQSNVTDTESINEAQALENNKSP